MANTILEKLQEKYSTVTGIDDARNIAEAVAAINGVGGRDDSTLLASLDRNGLDSGSG